MFFLCHTCYKKVVSLNKFSFPIVVSPRLYAAFFSVLFLTTQPWEKFCFIIKFCPNCFPHIFFLLWFMTSSKIHFRSSKKKKFFLKPSSHDRDFEMENLFFFYVWNGNFIAVVNRKDEEKSCRKCFFLFFLSFFSLFSELMKKEIK